MNINPTFSIISVVYNNHDGLKKTINSIINQTYHDFEYIIVDGASTDGSREVAKQYEDVFANFGIDYKIISEPDNGIYDAMNKGIDISKGEWLLFLNSGDSLASSDVLSLCELFCESSIDVIYGGTKYKFKNLVKLSGGDRLNTQSRQLENTTYRQADNVKQPNDVSKLEKNRVFGRSGGGVHE